MFIIVDGLDAAGKETLVGGIVRTLKNEGLDVATVSFPRYDTPEGIAIKSELAKPECDRDRAGLIGLFCKDRLNFLQEIGPDISNRVYVFDRYSMCNTMYNYHNIDDTEILTALRNDLSYPKLLELAICTSKSIMNVYIGHGDGLCSVAKHGLYLSNKPDADANETLELQIQFNENMENAIHNADVATPDIFLNVGFDMCNAIKKVSDEAVRGLSTSKYSVRGMSRMTDAFSHHHKVKVKNGVR